MPQYQSYTQQNAPGMQSGRGQLYAAPAHRGPTAQPRWYQGVKPKGLLSAIGGFGAPAGGLMKPPSPPKPPEPPTLGQKLALLNQTMKSMPAAARPGATPPQPAAPAPAPSQQSGPLAGFHSYMAQNPAIPGAILGAMPQFTTGVARLGGGLGLMGLTDMLMSGGNNIRQLLGGNPAAAPPKA